MTKQAPYGEWESPLSAGFAARAGVGLTDVTISPRGPLGVGPARHIFWCETIPGDGGRNAIKYAPILKGAPDSGSPTVDGPLGGVPREFAESSLISARSRVNEYGGGPFWVHGDPFDRTDEGRVWWVAADTQRIWSKQGESPSRVTTLEPPKLRALRYAAGVCTPDGEWSIVESERHCDSYGNPLPEAVNEISAVRPGLGKAIPLVHAGSAGWGDFVAEPKLSPDGRTLAWLRWDHPDMPWDAAELWAAGFHVDRGVPTISEPRRIAGGHTGGGVRGLGRAVSVCQPEFSPDGRLWWCDDSNDYWHLYFANTLGLPDEGSGDTATPLIPEAREEVGAPRWVSGGSRYGFVDEFTIVFTAMADGLESVWVYDTTTSTRTPLPGPSFTYVQSLAVVGRDVAIIGGAADIATSVFHVDLDTGDARDMRSARLPVEAAWISRPSPIEVAAEDGTKCHALFYPPVSGEFAGPDGAAPPLLVRIHGGPTASARPEFTTSVQFWTTRGFAVAEVNYRGSTGYGRAYRDMLNGQWGIADVRDCISVARHLAHEGLVDPQRCVIRGGSAGGFTALAALCFQHQWGFGATFAAACSLYGVTDLAALARDTHKFESRYLEGLVGEYPARADIYTERSPLSHADQLVEPVLILQGTEDKIVPPSQAEVLVDAMAARGVPHAYILFEGEGHGFQSQATVTRALESELGFYGQVLGFEPVGGVAVLQSD